jgi:hypothetical protein
LISAKNCSATLMNTVLPNELLGKWLCHADARQVFDLPLAPFFG